MNTQQHKADSAQEKNIATKTIAAVMTASVIAALSVSGAYLFVTSLNPAESDRAIHTATYCGDDGDKPQAAVNTCGEDKDKDKGGGDGSIDA